LAGQVAQCVLHVVAEMRNARADGEENQERRKNSQEVIESHAAALAENLILPAFPNCAVHQFRNRKTTQCPKVLHAISHLCTLVHSITPGHKGGTTNFIKENEKQLDFLIGVVVKYNSRARAIWKT
jgi:hypothetical protein